MEHINGVDLNTHTHIIFYFADIISENKHVKLQSIKNQTEAIVMQKWFLLIKLYKISSFSLQVFIKPPPAIES